MKLEEYLKKFATITREPSLNGMKYFMKEFGKLDKKTKFIHIAGTNGKGSVCEMMASILVNAGYTVRKIHISTFNKV